VISACRQKVAKLEVRRSDVRLVVVVEDTSDAGNNLWPEALPVECTRALTRQTQFFTRDLRESARMGGVISVCRSKCACATREDEIASGPIFRVTPADPSHKHPTPTGSLRCGFGLRRGWEAARVA
jgi:ferredoxin